MIEMESTITVSHHYENDLCDVIWKQKYGLDYWTILYDASGVVFSTVGYDVGELPGNWIVL